jgi:ATP-dependent exoDNAse (exonuclease V) beta subunit
VHQLLQRFLGGTVPDSTIMAYATQRLRRELPFDPETIDRLAVQSVEIFDRLCDHPDLVSRRHREFLFEVPFSFHDPSSPATSSGAEIVAGTIDCLAKGGDNCVTVLEFKTGAARPEHRRQLDAYLAAARAMFPDAKVDGRIVYPPVGTTRRGSGSK